MKALKQKASKSDENSTQQLLELLNDEIGGMLFIWLFDPNNEIFTEFNLSDEIINPDLFSKKIQEGKTESYKKPYLKLRIGIGSVVAEEKTGKPVCTKKGVEKIRNELIESLKQDGFVEFLSKKQTELKKNANAARVLKVVLEHK